MLILQKDAGVLRTGGRGCQLRRPTVSCKLPLEPATRQRAASVWRAPGFGMSGCPTKGTNVSAVIKWINAVIKRDRRSGYRRARVEECALRIEPVWQLRRG